MRYTWILIVGLLLVAPMASAQQLTIDDLKAAATAQAETARALQPGDSATFSIDAQGMQMSMTQELVEVTETGLMLRQITSVPGMGEMPAEEMEMPFANPEDFDNEEGSEPEISADTIEAAGMTFECLLVVDAESGFKAWFCSSLGFNNGIVRMEMEGMIIELTELSLAE